MVILRLGEGKNEMKRREMEGRQDEILEICNCNPREHNLCGGIPGVCLVPFAVVVAVVVPLTVLMLNGCRKCKLSEAKMRGNAESVPSAPVGKVSVDLPAWWKHVTGIMICFLAANICRWHGIYIRYCSLLLLSSVLRSGISAVGSAPLPFSIPPPALSPTATIPTCN